MAAGTVRRMATVTERLIDWGFGNFAALEWADVGILKLGSDFLGMAIPIILRNMSAVWL